MIPSDAPAARNTDPETSKQSAADVALRAGTHRALMLEAFWYSKGLTAEEAFDKTDLPPRCCYWKRVSELRQGGYLVDTGETRVGTGGSPQTVYRMTEEGALALLHLAK